MQNGQQTDPHQTTDEAYKLGIQLAEQSSEAVHITGDAAPLIASIEEVHKKNPAIKAGFYSTIAEYIAAGFKANCA
jgi:hypothetical protein